MKLIALTQGKAAIVDDDDYIILSTYKWYARWDKHTKSFYAMRNSPKINGKSFTIRMHREICKARTGEHVDHSNRDTLDNRKSNLRICSQCQNTANTKLKSNNKSGFKGVHYHGQSRKWRATVRVGGKHISLGLYSSPIDAAISYDIEATRQFGEFALTNKKLGLIP